MLSDRIGQAFTRSQNYKNVQNNQREYRPRKNRQGQNYPREERSEVLQHQHRAE